MLSARVFFEDAEEKFLGKDGESTCGEKKREELLFGFVRTRAHDSTTLSLSLSLYFTKTCTRTRARERMWTIYSYFKTLYNYNKHAYIYLLPFFS